MRKLYTLGHDPKFDGDGDFIPEIHEQAVSVDVAGKTNDQIMAEVAVMCWRKADAVALVADHIKMVGAKSVVSFGAGWGVLEDMLSTLCPGVGIVATEFNPVYVDFTKRCFPHIEAGLFDMQREDPKTLGKFDLAFSFGSMYVLNDDRFHRLLRDVEAPIFIDLEPEIMRLRDVLFHATEPVRHASILRRIFGKPPVRLGRFHGYARTRNEYHTLYTRTHRVIDETYNLGPYGYIATLERKD